MKNLILIGSAISLFLSCVKNPSSVKHDKHILASYNKTNIENLAKSFKNDANLIIIKSDHVDQNGKSVTWLYIYYSSSADSLYYFSSIYDDCVLDSIVNQSILCVSHISHDWFDSNRAMEIAEENGGKTFRDENPEYVIQASLSEPCMPNTSTNWYISYRSEINDSNNLFLGINASTGEVLPSSE